MEARAQSDEKRSGFLQRAVNSENVTAFEGQAMAKFAYDRRHIAQVLYGRRNVSRYTVDKAHSYAHWCKLACSGRNALPATKPKNLTLMPSDIDPRSSFRNPELGLLPLPATPIY